MAKAYSPKAYQERKARKAASAGNGDFESFASAHEKDKLQDGEQQKLSSQGLNKGSSFQQYIEENGDYQKPDVMSGDELKRYAEENGLVQIYRGVTDVSGLKGSEMNDATVHGDKYYTGNGIYGDGLYFSTDKRVANEYATMVDKNDKPRNGSILTAAVKPTAKKIEYDSLVKQFNKTSYAKNYSKKEKIHDGGYAAAMDAPGVLSAFARKQGYDVITLPRPNKSTHYIVLNRGATIMSADYEKGMK